MSLWLTSLPRVTVTKAWVQSGRSQWAGARAGAEGRRVGYSCLCPVLTGPEASAIMSFFLSMWRNVHGAHSFSESSEGWLWKKLALGEITCGSYPDSKFKALC